MEIRSVDLGDDHVMSQIAAIAERVGRHERPHAPAFSAQAHIARLRGADSGERMFLAAAFDGGRDDRVLGSGSAFIFLLDNTDFAGLHVEVDPVERRAGVGDALLEHLTAAVLAEGRHTLCVDSLVPFDQLETHPDRRFLEHRGYTYSNVEVVRHQEVPVAEELLTAWEARAGERAAAYRIETHVGGVPEELQESLRTLLGLLGVDAPTGAVDFEEEKVTPQRFAERYVTAEAMGVDVFETMAVTADGVVAAQSTIGAPRERPEAFQWGTYVHREHRGHSLGLAVKVANLRAVQAAHPHLRRIITQNAESNSWMIAINEEMGYRPVEASLEMVRRL